MWRHAFDYGPEMVSAASGLAVEAEAALDAEGNVVGMQVVGQRVARRLELAGNR
jgi:hypothetical protein